MEVNFVHFVAVISIFQSIFLTLFFFTNKNGNKTSNRILAYLMLTFAAMLTYVLSNSEVVYKYFDNYRRLMVLIGQSAFFIAPLLYFFVRSSFEKDFKLSPKLLVHFTPALLWVVYFSLYFHSSGEFYSWFYYRSITAKSFLLIQEIIYVALIYKLLKNNKIGIKGLFSFSQNDNWNWLKLFVIGFILLWNLEFESFLLVEVSQLWDVCPYTQSLYFLYSFIFFNTLFFILMRKPSFISSQKKYEKSELCENNKSEYKTKLLSYMENEKPYLNPSTSLSSLSKDLKVPTRHLSQVINESFNKNFNDFINSYRIRESEKLILESDKITMLEIAYKVGFNSKSSFYDAFKKQTGMAPGEYKSYSLDRVGLYPN